MSRRKQQVMKTRLRNAVNVSLTAPGNFPTPNGWYFNCNKFFNSAIHARASNRRSRLLIQAA